MQTTAFLGAAHSHTADFISRLNQRADVQVKYVYDHSAGRAAATAAALQAEMADVDTILQDTEVTSVVICSETRHHVDLVERAAAAGKHLFVEKPLTFDGEAAERLATLVEKAGVVFQTGFFQRGAPGVQFLRQEAQAGHLGTITRMRYPNCHNGLSAGWLDGEHRWFTERAESGGGALLDMGAHALDILLWVLGPVCGKPVRYAATLGSPTHRCGDIDEWGAGIVTFENGAAGILEASWVDPHFRQAVEIHGTRGQLFIQDRRVRYFSELVEGADGSEWTDLPPAMPHAFELFWDKLAGHDVPLVAVREAAQGASVMQKLYRAAGAPAVAQSA